MEHSCGQRCAVRTSWRRCGRRGRVDEPLKSVSLASLESDEGRSKLLRALQADGAVLLTSSPEDRLEEKVAACYETARAFFCRSLADKARHGAGSGVGQLHGYMSMLNDGGSECFEAKLCYDRRFVWPLEPAGFATAVRAAAELFISVATRALEALCHALSMDVRHVVSTLDGAVGGDAAAGASLDESSHSAMRVWSYTRGERSGWHVDNTLLTVAPPGSAVGLRARLLDGRLLRPEERMGADQLLLFAGDALSYLSAGRLLPLLHDVRPPPRGAPRLSMPFFLRARRAALLQPGRASPGIGASLPPLRVADLEANVGNLRSRWPWKQAGYFENSEWFAEERPELR